MTACLDGNTLRLLSARAARSSDVILLLNEQCLFTDAAVHQRQSLHAAAQPYAHHISHDMCTMTSDDVRRAL